jgi:hypothetical protein
LLNLLIHECYLLSGIQALLPDPQFFNQSAVALDLAALEIIEEGSPQTNHPEEALAGMMILLVLFEVIGQIVNTLGQERYLYLG